jgi:hypothetical protein
MERMRISDPYVWGKLVKSWIKGTATKPGNITELKAQMSAVGLATDANHIPASITGLAILDYDKHLLMIRLPPKDLVEASEQTFGTPAGAYPLPSFYDAFYVNAARRNNMTPEERKKLHDARIGEYTVNSCK